MKKHTIVLYKVLTTLVFAGISFSCTNEQVDDLFKKFVKSPPSSIERVVIGHDQVYTVQAILRMSRKSDRTLENGDNIYTAYDIAHFETPIPVYQELTISRDEKGRTIITSDRKAFDVIKSDNFYYGLELKYFDINGNNINHQFAQISDLSKSNETKRALCKRSPNATIYQHQHFFTIGNASLGYKSKDNQLAGKLPLVYPMTRDSLYYDDYTFKMTNGEFNIAKSTSESAIYVPLEKHTPNQLKYNLPLATQAEAAKSLDLYSAPDGKKYQLVSALASEELNEHVPDIFTYEYRDTDPMNKMLGEEVEFDDLGDNRGLVIEGFHAPYTIRMRIDRALGGSKKYEHLGFKGMLQFKKANVHFQMQVSIFHIKNAEIGNRSGLGGKYDNNASPNTEVRYNYHTVKSSLGDFDSQLTIPFRVMADADSNGDRQQCIKDIQLYYPQANLSDLERLLWEPDSYFRNYPSKNM